MLGCAIFSLLTACGEKPTLTERPMVEALKPPVNTLGGCVVRRDWGCTTSATRDIVAIMDSADGLQPKP